VKFSVVGLVGMIEPLLIDGFLVNAALTTHRIGKTDHTMATQATRWRHPRTLNQPTNVRRWVFGMGGAAAVSVLMRAPP
jgi:hypothetical protein